MKSEIRNDMVALRDPAKHPAYPPRQPATKCREAFGVRRIPPLSTARESRTLSRKAGLREIRGPETSLPLAWNPCHRGVQHRSPARSPELATLGLRLRTSVFGFRLSDFFRISAFGFRI